MRGMKWHNFRDRDGNYPKGIMETEKANDLNTYLEFVKGKNVDEVNEIIKELSLLARTNKKKLPLYKEKLELLKNLGTKSQGKK